VSVTKRGVPVVPIGRVVEPTHDLDVLLRHRLLRQPCGFEGFDGAPKPGTARLLALDLAADEAVAAGPTLARVETWSAKEAVLAVPAD
jgi:hypothetical protein